MRQGIKEANHPPIRVCWSECAVDVRLVRFVAVTLRTSDSACLWPWLRQVLRWQREHSCQTRRQLIDHRPSGSPVEDVHGSGCVTVNNQVRATWVPFRGGGAGGEGWFSSGIETNPFMTLVNVNATRLRNLGCGRIPWFQTSCIGFYNNCIGTGIWKIGIRTRFYGLYLYRS